MDGNKGIFTFDFALAGGMDGNKGIFTFDFPLAGGMDGNKGIFTFDFALAGGKGRNKGIFKTFQRGNVTRYKCIPVEGIGKGSGNPGDRQGASANFSSVVADVHEADADSAYSTTVLRI
ncbi:hypothetical protein PAECIP111892_03643 [Paenibacillus auburnensis]|uniref:Uncharacterized protein n=1 Tax=Paenibacillus auburnensis TaxID=2905649 RepID=A0ABM9CG54_9BACL|nr:hypothetical protein PAECIP111892_03643 [Paenibacillus auburnensis]